VPLLAFSLVAGIAILEFASPAASGRSRSGRPAGLHWVASWAASPQPASRRRPEALRGFDDETIRELVFPSVSGRLVRVRFSNTYGSRPVRVGGAAIAADPAGDGATAGPRVALSFGGRPGVTIAPGAVATAEPVRFPVKALHELAVSVYLPGATGAATVHIVAAQRSYLAAGDQVLDPGFAPFVRGAPSWFFLTGVSVLADSRVRGAIVAIGDSITDGLRSRIGANARWPNDLARRIDATAGPTMSVIDEGIAGNRVLTSSPCYGTDAVGRFRRDVLAQPGVRDVILLEGTNDIGMSDTTSWCSAPHTNVSAGQIIAGDERMIEQAHAAGLRIFGGTILPFRGAVYWTAAGEAKREAINRWIRTSGAFDGVIDFARAVADPGDREIIDPRFDSGDHVHPNDAGYQAMADAVQLAPLLR
jgi:lysophospholipase L1-like esterase